MRRGRVAYLANLIFEAIDLKKEGLTPFIITHALFGMVGIAALMRTTSAYLAPATNSTLIRTRYCQQAFANSTYLTRFVFPA